MKAHISNNSKIAELHEKLLKVIAIEHSTIPPYLFAYWSIKDRSSETARIILEITKQEMMHMAMACNILNATGGVPKCNRPDFIPDYPCALPGHSETQFPFVVGLTKLNIDSIITFLEIERPRSTMLKLQDPKTQEPIDKGWETIADFYLEITALIWGLNDADFNHGKQLKPSDKPDNPGTLFSVYNKSDAIRCIAEILEEGEGLGLNKSGSEDSHFQRFVTIYREMGGLGDIKNGGFSAKELKNKVDQTKYADFMNGIRNISSNPRILRSNAQGYILENQRFNSAYSKMLDHIQGALTMNEPSMGDAVKNMFALGRHADAIMSIPIDPEFEENGYCGPTFEYLMPDLRI